MSDDTRRILDLLAQGKITVDEADQLLAAIAASAAHAAETNDRTGAGEASTQRWVRIRIQKQPKVGHEGKEVNSRVPIAGVKGGMRLGAIIGTFAGENAAQRMKERGIDLDLSKINADFS